jgi:uncharacterized membrane protein
MNKIFKKFKLTPKNIGIILFMLGFIGLAASFILTLEKIALLKNPSHNLSCAISPLLSCGPIINSPEASVFGFPNPLIGLIGFPLVMSTGLLLAMGVKIPKKYFKLFLVGPVLGMAFVLWLIFETTFEIKALCIYCMVAWAVTWPILYLSTLHAYRSGYIKNKYLKYLDEYKKYLLPSFYIAVILLILYKFWYYWSTLI